MILEVLSSCWHPVVGGPAGDYDSEETGTEESGSDSSDDESIPALEDADSEGSAVDANGHTDQSHPLKKQI